jgi:hypothetical protein
MVGQTDLVERGAFGFDVFSHTISNILMENSVA